MSVYLLYYILYCIGLYILIIHITYIHITFLYPSFLLTHSLYQFKRQKLYMCDFKHIIIISIIKFFTVILSFLTPLLLLLLLSTPLHQRAASRVQHPNHVAANSLSPQVARKGSTLSGFVQRSRLEREVGRDLHSNKWEEV